MIYHDWCQQELMVRYTSTAVVFFVSGLIGIYSFNFPLWLFGIDREISYLSISGGWNVICMICIWTLHLYFIILSNWKILHQTDYDINNTFSNFINSFNFIDSTSSFYLFAPIITYPFASFCFTSFYLSWLGLPFSSSINSSSKIMIENNPTITIIQYSVCLLSFIYGYIPHQFGNYNKISFKTIQTSRFLFLKQNSYRLVISNMIQTFTFCVCCTLFWVFIIKFLGIPSFNNDGGDGNDKSVNYWMVFWILFRITFCLNYLWQLSYLLMHRFLTEKCDMSRYNDCPAIMVESLNNQSNTLNRNIDCRLIALTQSFYVNFNKPIQTLYFFNLSLINLLDIVQFNPKQRKSIYSTQIYYNLIVQSLLSEFTTFIISLYETIYGDNNLLNRNNMNNTTSFNMSFNRSFGGGNAMQNKSLFGQFWYKQFTLKPEISHIFRNYEILIHSSDILSFLIIHSLEEDELGIVQESLEQILCVLLECIDILDLFLKSQIYKTLYKQGYGGGGTSNKTQIINALYKGIETSLTRIIVAMHPYLDSLTLPPKNAHRLQSYLVQ